MILLDANYILRFLLKDNLKMYEEAKNCIITNECKILTEVFAEVVFVLQKVYKVNRTDIQTTLSQLLKYKTIFIDEQESILKALKIFASKNLDFVDAVLCAKSYNYQIKTFDKKLNKCINSFK